MLLVADFNLFPTLSVSFYFASHYTYHKSYLSRDASYFVGQARGPSPSQTACLTSAVLNIAQLTL